MQMIAFGMENFGAVWSQLNYVVKKRFQSIIYLSLLSK